MFKTSRLKLLVILGTFCFFGMSSVSSVYCEDGFSSVLDESAELTFCADEDYGIRYYCEQGWIWRRVEGALLVVISQDPVVTMTVHLPDPRIKFFSQINKAFVQGRGVYGSGYRIEQVRFAGEEAVKVKAFAQDYENIRLADYYFIRNATLYGVYFTVFPKDKWPEAKFLIKQVVDTFSFEPKTDGFIH